MKDHGGVRPGREPWGWTFGNGFLPNPGDWSHLWRIIKDIIDQRESGVLILAHHNADIDAVGTAMILKKTFPWVDLGAYKSISHGARNLLSSMDVEMKVDPDISRYSYMVIVDSSSPLQVSGGDISHWPRYAVIDHHPDHSHWDGDAYIDSSLGACVEIALQISLMSGADLDEGVAVPALAGIIADTGKFRFARPVDMSVCSMILEGCDIRMENVLGVIEGDEYFDVSKKVAQLKAMRRLRFEKVGDQVVAVSQVSSFEAAAARALLVAGADVVFIGAERKNELRISSRAKPHILAKGVHLGHFMEEIGRATGNQGGGHDGAAGLNGTGNADRALDLCMERMVSLLAEKQGIDPPPPHSRGKGGNNRGYCRSGRERT